MSSCKFREIDIYKCVIVRFQYKFVIIVLFSTVKNNAMMHKCFLFFPKQIYCCIEGIDHCKIFSDKDDIKIVSISTVNCVSHISIVQYFISQAGFFVVVVVVCQLCSGESDLWISTSTEIWLFWSFTLGSLIIQVKLNKIYKKTPFYKITYILVYSKYRIYI